MNKYVQELREVREDAWDATWKVAYSAARSAVVIYNATAWRAAREAANGAANAARSVAWYIPFIDQDLHAQIELTLELL